MKCSVFFFKVVIFLSLEWLPMASWMEESLCLCVSAVSDADLGWDSRFWLSLPPAPPRGQELRGLRQGARGPSEVPRVPGWRRVHRWAVLVSAGAFVRVGPPDSSGPFLSLAAPTGSLLLSRMPSLAQSPACPAGNSGPSDACHPS